MTKHALQRMRERFGVDAKFADIDLARTSILAGRSELLRSRSEDGGYEWHRVRICNIEVVALFSKRRKTIVTVTRELEDPKKHRPGVGERLAMLKRGRLRRRRHQIPPEVEEFG